MRLTRTAFRADGIFGRLYNDHGVPIAFTLEHAYPQADGSFAPKLSLGEHICIRGTHKLHNLIPFETFEITDLPHTNILFHAGNFNKDSEGCVLLGHSMIKQADGSEMLTSSRSAFEEFMQSLIGINSFQLTVTNEE